MTLGGLLLSAGAAAPAGEVPLSKQLTAAGRQALAQGRKAEARAILLNALKLDPADAEARAALARTGVVLLAGYQDPAPAPPQVPAPAAPLPGDEPQAPGVLPGQATLGEQARLETVRRQEFSNAVRQRLQRARDLDALGRPDEALAELRTTLNSVTASDAVPEADRRRLESEVRSQIGRTEADSERVALDRAESYRRLGADEARIRALAQSEKDQDTIGVLMSQFDNLMAQGTFLVYSTAGTGNIDITTAPFQDARSRAVAARAIDPVVVAPYAAIFTTQTRRFLSQSLLYNELARYRALLSMQDVDRAAVPFPDSKTIEYPDAADFIAMTERRRARYGEGNETQLGDRDERTKAIVTQLNERLTMSFPNETPLEDVLKYIRSNTQSEALDLPTGIPIYVDPVGLQEAEKTLTSPVTLDLEGIPLKTSLRLILKQLGLTYTVKDGLMTITSANSDDQPTEIRVYPVADLAIIPISLMGGGGGGMGGGMGGGGMGGGGMGGMGGGMGGFGSIPPQDPATTPSRGTAGGLEEKKSN